MLPRVRITLLALACAAGVAACGSSAHGGGASSTAAPSATVTRTVTRASSSASTTTAPSSSSSATTATTSAATSSAATPSAAAGGQCVAAGLALSSIGGGAATGHELLAFALTNTSGHSCHTGGYPGVQFLDAAGHPLPTVPDHTTDDFFGQTVLRELTLAPGQHASFRLGVTDVASGDSGAGCVTVGSIGVIAPNDTATLHIARTVHECDGRVSVSPLQAGDAARG